MVLGVLQSAVNKKGSLDVVEAVYEGEYNLVRRNRKSCQGHMHADENRPPRQSPRFTAPQQRVQTKPGHCYKGECVNERFSCVLWMRLLHTGVLMSDMHIPNLDSSEPKRTGRLRRKHRLGSRLVICFYLLP